MQDVQHRRSAIELHAIDGQDDRALLPKALLKALLVCGDAVAHGDVVVDEVTHAPLADVNAILRPQPLVDPGDGDPVEQVQFSRENKHVQPKLVILEDNSALFRRPVRAPRPDAPLLTARLPLRHEVDQAAQGFDVPMPAPEASQGDRAGQTVDPRGHQNPRHSASQMISSLSPHYGF